MSEMTITVTGAGEAVITRVPGATSADVHLSITLPADDDQATRRLTALATHLRALIGPPRT
jgi:hypothetical protein